MKKLFSSLYLGIFFIPLVITPFSLNMYSSGKIFWFLLFLSLVFFFCAFNVFQNQQIEVQINKYLNFYLVLFLLSCLFATIFSLTPIQSLFGTYDYVEGLVFYVLLIIHFFVCLQIFAEERWIHVFFLITKFLTVLICFHAIGQYFNFDPFIDVDNKEYLFRVYSTIGQPNFLGQFLIFPFFISFFSLKDWWQRKQYQFLTLEIGLFSLIGITLLFTHNRATWLAVSLVLLLWFFIYFPLKKIYKWGIIFSCMIGIITMINFVNINLRSFYSRSFLWEALPKTLNWENFVFGNGLNSFYQTFVAIMPKEIFEYENFYTLPDHIHNEFLNILTERGIFGVAVYLLPILFLIYLFLHKKVKNILQKITFFTLVAYLISVQFSFSSIEHYVFLAAFWAILLNQTVELQTLTIIVRKFFNNILKVVFFLLAMIILLSGVFFLRTDILLKQGISEYFGDLEKSYLSFENAAQSLPVFAYPQKLIIDLFSAPFTEDYPFFEQKLQRHLDNYGLISNKDFNYHILGIKIASWHNDLDQVAQHFNLAFKLAPNLPLLYTETANAYLENENCKKALFYYEKLKLLAPKSAFLENDPNYQKREEYRLFRKHATAFFDLEEKVKKCE